jgi:hypothetical protein
LLALRARREHGRYSQRFTDKETYGKEVAASTLLTAAAFAIPEIRLRSRR